MSTQTKPLRENEFGMPTLPIFSPFTVGRIETVKKKVFSGVRAGQEYDVYDVTVRPVNYVGKEAIFQMSKTQLDQLRAIIFVIGTGCVIDATYSDEKRKISFSGQLKK